MIKEKYVKMLKEVSINIVQTKIESVRKKDITKRGFRVYKDGYIGVGGAVGEVDYREETLSEEEFVNEGEELLSILREDFPEFIFSNKIYLTEMETRLTNDVGLDLVHKDRVVTAGLLIKENTSVNVIDAFVMYADRNYNRTKLLEIIRETLAAYKNPVKLPYEGKMPVIFMDKDIMPLSKIIEELNGYKVGTGASLFKDLIGDKKFNENFTLFQSYDTVPTLAPRNFKVEASDKTLKELLGGQLGVVALIASGGDFTEEGVFGTPVQLAFLTDGEKLIGRLPQLSLSGELYSMFGGDYIGKSKDEPFLGQKALALNLDVKYL